MAASRAPRRLSPGARREQLAVAAQGLIARDGYAAFSLDEVAEQAGVTRNLLYHYFPRGRLDLFVAAIEHGGEQLTGEWVTDPELPLDERLTANFRRMVAAATAPTPEWMVYRQARSSVEPDVQATLARYVDRVISSIALNHLGTSEPSPFAHLAIGSYLAFAEHALDEARTQRLDPEELLELLGRTLLEVVAVVGGR